MLAPAIAIRVCPIPLLTVYPGTVNRSTGHTHTHPTAEQSTHTNTVINTAGAIRRNFKSQRSKARARPSKAGATRKRGRYYKDKDEDDDASNSADGDGDSEEREWCVVYI